VSLFWHCSISGPGRLKDQESSTARIAKSRIPKSRKKDVVAGRFHYFGTREIKTQRTRETACITILQIAKASSVVAWTRAFLAFWTQGVREARSQKTGSPNSRNRGTRKPESIQRLREDPDS
jgi:hypothetical protein